MKTPAFLFPCLLLAALSQPALADDDAQTDAGTEQLIQEGITLRRSGKDEAALAVFLDAEKRSPKSVRVLLHVTTAAQAMGRWSFAYQYLQKAEVYRDDPYYQRYRSSIRSVEEVLVLRLGKFRVVGSPAGADVSVNGESIGQLPMDEPKVLETGSYTLEVRKAGYFPLKRPITIGPALALTSESVDLNLIHSDANAAHSPQPVGTSGPSETRTTPPLQARWISWTLAGTGAALLATSGVAFLVRENEVGRWNDDARCLDPASPSSSREELCGNVRTKAETAQSVALVTGALGLGFGAAAIAHFAWSRGASSHPTSTALRTPRCALGIGAVLCSGSF